VSCSIRAWTAPTRLSARSSFSCTSAGRRAGALSAPLHAAAYWIKNYLLRGGFLDGEMARRYHALHARYVYEKYRLLRSLQLRG
jgi:hypothetical protein